MTHTQHLLSFVAVVSLLALGARAESESPGVPRSEADAAASLNEVRAAVLQIKDSQKRVLATQKLREFAASAVVPELAGALARGEYGDDSGALDAAFELLVGKASMPEWSGELGPLADRAVIEVLMKGAVGNSAGGRCKSISALGRAPEAFRVVAIQTLRSALEHEDLATVYEAAQSLGKIGSTARDALPALLILLRNPVVASASRSQGDLRKHTADERVRAAAALARIRIGGAAVDLAEYPNLDAVGRAAAAGALLADYQLLFYDIDDSGAPAAPTQVAVHRAVTASLASLFHDDAVSVKVRADIVRAVAGQLLLPALDREVAFVCERLLQDAAKSSDAKIRFAAEQIIAKRPN